MSVILFMTHDVKASTECGILNLQKNCYLTILDFLNDGENTKDQITFMRILSRTKKEWVKDLCLCYEKQTFEKFYTVVYRCKGYHLLSKHQHYVNFTPKPFRQIIQWNDPKAQCIRNIYLTKEKKIQFEKENWFGGEKSIFEFEKHSYLMCNLPDNFWEQTFQDIFVEPHRDTVLFENGKNTYFLRLYLDSLKIYYRQNTELVDNFKQYISAYGYVHMYQEQNGNKYNFIEFYATTLNGTDLQFHYQKYIRIPYFITSENKDQIAKDFINKNKN